MMRLPILLYAFTNNARSFTILKSSKKKSRRLNQAFSPSYEF